MMTKNGRSWLIVLIQIWSEEMFKKSKRGRSNMETKIITKEAVIIISIIIIDVITEVASITTIDVKWIWHDLKIMSKSRNSKSKLLCSQPRISLKRMTFRKSDSSLTSLLQTTLRRNSKSWEKITYSKVWRQGLNALRMKLNMMLVLTNFKKMSLILRSLISLSKTLSRKLSERRVTVSSMVNFAKEWWS